MKNQRGATLIEMMIALVIVSIILIGASLALFKSRQMSEDARKSLLALNAAKTALETIKNTPLASVSGLSTASMVPAGLTNGAIAIATNPANVAGVTLATVTVTVTWTGSSNRAQTIRFSTQRSSY